MLDNFIVVTILALLSLYTKDTLSQHVTNEIKLPDWDYLMYSQRWPISACVEWEDKAKDNVCTLPKEPNFWTVHGLWPTKNGTTDDPQNCKSAIHFDPDQLQPILSDLENHWTNIEGNTKNNSFWSHEWDKHGTCASVLPQLNSVYSYFKTGLLLNTKYNLTSILASSNIVPSMNNYTVQNFIQGIQKELNITPQIRCTSDSKTKESLISELRLCFNKEFELFNCTDVTPQPQDSGCSKKKPIKYLKEVPGEMAPASIDVLYINPQDIISQEEMFQEWYTLVKFLMWFTL